MKEKFLWVVLFQFFLSFPVPAQINQKSAVIEREEFIFNEAPFEQCHASTLAETQNGLVVAWFGGTHEKNKDVEIWISRKSGGVWTAPVSAADGIYQGKRYPTWNPVLFQVPGAELILFYKVGPDPKTWWGMLKRSMDEGITWSEAEKLPDGILGPIKNKPELLNSGKLICPSSTEHKGWKVQLEITPDFGRTWEPVVHIDPSSVLEVIQPAIIFPGEEKMQILCRSKNGVIVTAFSNDSGLSWSPLEKTDLPNPNSGIDAVTLADGRHVLIYNHSNKPDNKWGGPRYPLNLAVSDDGVEWKASLVLEDEPGEYSYPAIIQGREGKIHMVYTWKRDKIKYLQLNPGLLP